MKIEEQVLSREQMAHLVELGVDTSDASMVWVIEKNDTDFKYATIIINNRYLYGTEGIYNFIPTYTIGDLIEKLPKQIGDYELFIELGRKCGYRCLSDRMYVFAFNRHLDGLYKLICWVAENFKELIK